MAQVGEEERLKLNLLPPSLLSVAVADAVVAGVVIVIW